MILPITNQYNFFYESIKDMENKEKVTLIDGGLSTELNFLGFQIKDTILWTAKWLKDNPNALKQAHLK
jgi:S-methylmethionine-dependent homocysteine/selenocysteine methylase